MFGECRICEENLETQHAVTREDVGGGRGSRAPKTCKGVERRRRRRESRSGIEDFIKPLSSSRLRENLPKLGPIVVVSVHEERCDAIALIASHNEPLHIRLPDFSWKKAAQYHDKLKNGLRSAGLRAPGEAITAEDLNACQRGPGPYRRPKTTPECGVRAVLQGLWQEVVKPVLDKLGFKVSVSYCVRSSDADDENRKQSSRPRKLCPGYGGVSCGISTSGSDHVGHQGQSCARRREGLL